MNCYCSVAVLLTHSHQQSQPRLLWAVRAWQSRRERPSGRRRSARARSTAHWCAANPSPGRKAPGRGRMRPRVRRLVAAPSPDRPSSSPADSLLPHADMAAGREGLYYLCAACSSGQTRLLPRSAVLLPPLLPARWTILACKPDTSTASTQPAHKPKSFLSISTRLSNTYPNLSQ